MDAKVVQLRTSIAALADKSAHVRTKTQYFNTATNTLISRQWYYVMPTAILIFVVLNILLFEIPTEICKTIKPYSPWNHTVAGSCLSCMVLLIIQNGIYSFKFSKFRTEKDHLLGVDMAGTTICLITSIGEIYFHAIY